ncbi:inactive leucine-rich repeat receptor-like protein kinase CORYNE [Macadamia integrifolia]|uniref:inactive leucine-rich repeat receptor-like protein kinase CORYNE n=1 Tax=Macadamia integrifolia TaxID=60698 RepID=UPI001C4FC81E|nr:inactive leucine-rich repeat receptor-like protein kinase CORYNE [Macadamia integrifolia]
MDKRGYKSGLNHKSLALLALFMFFLRIAQGREEMTEQIPTASPSPSRVPEFRNSLRRICLSILFGILTGLLSAVLFACLVSLVLRYMSRTPVLKGPVIFTPKIDPKTLQLALSTDNHQLIGSSHNGKYYRVVLDGGVAFAVKRLEPFEKGCPEIESKSVKRRIQQELEMLAGLKHRNLMSLRAYFREPICLSLVYDYIPTGSLEDAMNRVRENQLRLSWEVRHRIAVGVIKGLQHLHFSCSPRVLHHNLKPTNIMLDPEYEPLLSDIGLAKLTPNLGTRASSYTAPECFQNCRYTDKSDIFSFGIILGVLLTGRDPLDPFFGEGAGGGSLVRWLRHLQQAGEALEALDKSILGEEGEEDEMLMAVRIAVVCLSDLPADRPSSDELVPMLTQLHSF